MKPVVADVGVSEYKHMLELQRSLNHLRNEGRVPDILILTEHEPVYTVGIHRNASELLDPSIQPVPVERGGSVTYHGPGQIVVYFILSLLERHTNIKEIILSVQKAITKTLSAYGIDAEGRLAKETGVWTSGRKICSIGFAIRESSTFHGIALNVSTDLSAFGRIMPCGFDSAIMTSMENEAGHGFVEAEVSRTLVSNILHSLSIEKFEKMDSLEGLEALLQ